MKFLSLVEYLWIDGTKPIQQMRSKSRVMSLPIEPKVSDFTEWHFDGPSVGQNARHDLMCILRPVRMYPDPLRGGESHIVLCEVYDSGGNTHESNQRARLRSILSAADDDINPWLGFQQSYRLLRSDCLPGYSSAADPTFSKRYYCGVGYDNVFGRDIAEAHAKACMSAGVLLYSVHAERMRGQWEFQIGYRNIEGEACDALSVADDVWFSRYLLDRIGEQYGMHVSLESRSIKSNKNDASMHTNFSTAFTRDPRCGLTAIQVIIKALESIRYDSIEECGDYLVQLDTPPPLHQHLQQQDSSEQKSPEQDPARNESLKMDTLTQNSGVGSEFALNIPLQVIHKGYGYIKDRRPRANSDPYRVAIHLIRAACGDSEKAI